VVSVIFLLFTSFLWATHFGSDPINHPPKVTLSLAGNIVSVAPGQQVIFTVSVSDPEDGSSDYQEIPIHEVFIKIKYVKHLFNNDIKNYNYNFSPGFINIKEARCFDCHQWKTDLVGPSFDKIKTANQQKAANKLVNSILQGSVGNWGNEMMPAQEIPETKAREIIDWLLGEDSNSIVEISRGLEGLFLADPAIQQGHYLLVASYRDRGVGEEMSDRKTGYHSIALTIVN